MQPSLFRTALVLGLLSAVGPFTIDMYLPAMPAIAEDLGGTIAATQATLTGYFIAFGLAQLIYGPMADQIGRKPPIYIGMAVFILGSVGCALAPSIGWLTAARAVQGLGAAAVMVIPRAIIRDMHTGIEATRLMALLMLVISVSPMLAPLAGAGMLALGSWRLIFWALCGAAVLSLLLTVLAQPETLRPENRRPVNLGSLLQGAGVLLRDPVFMGLTFVGGFGMASFFVFIASASFVYSGQFGLSPTGFGLAFAANALGFIGASQFAALSLMLDQAPTVIVLLSAIAVNLRMAMYSASLAAHLGPARLWQRALVAYMNVDQTYAVSVLEYDAKPAMTLPEKLAYFFGTCLPIVPTWCVATYVGALVGEAVPASWGLDFAVPIAFLSMVAPALRTMAHVAAAAASILLAIAFAGLPYNLGLMPAGIGAMIVGAEVERRMGHAFPPPGARP